MPPFFPFLEEADFMLLDTKRQRFVIDRVDEEAYQNKFQWLFENRKIVYEVDGIYQFKK